MCVILLDEEVFTSSTFGWLMWILLTIVPHSLIQGSLGWGGGGGDPLIWPNGVTCCLTGFGFQGLKPLNNGI